MTEDAIQSAEALPPVPGAVMRDAVRYAADGRTPRAEAVAEEVPTVLVFNRFPFSVILASPLALDDLAVGFSLTEKLVARVDDIEAVNVVAVDQGFKVDVTLGSTSYAALRERHRRTLLVGSSCGLCGTDSFAEALRPIDPVRSARTFRPEAITRAMGGLAAGQGLNRVVGAVHAAAFATPDGEIVAVREDIGRHNALDKLIGHLARSGVAASAGFAVVSSRCSYEMVHKTAAAGIPLIASVSAPTSLAIGLAESCGVGLAAFVREGRFTVYATPGRIA